MSLVPSSVYSAFAFVDVPFAVSIDNSAAGVLVPVVETLFPAASTYAVRSFRRRLEEFNG